MSGNDRHELPGEVLSEYIVPRREARQRNCIERVLGHLKINRAIATRYDQLAESFLGMLFIASARYWIKFVHAA